MSFISSFEIIKVAVQEPCIFFWIFVSTAEAGDVFFLIEIFLPKVLLLSLMDLLIYLLMNLKILETELF